MSEGGHCLMNIIGITRYQYQELCELLPYLYNEIQSLFYKHEALRVLQPRTVGGHYCQSKVSYQRSMKKIQQNNIYKIHRLTIHYGNQNVNNSTVHLLNEVKLIYIIEIQYTGTVYRLAH